MLCDRACEPRDAAKHRECGRVLFVRGTQLLSGSARGDIKEVEGERQQEVQEDKGDEEIGGEVNGEVEESHSTCA